jgi:hypothetical protein
MASIGPKSGSRTQESRRVTSLSSPYGPRGNSRRMKRPETVDQFRKDAKSFEADLHRKYFKPGSDT